MFMFCQVSAQTCLATRLRQVLALRSISPRAQELVVCLEAQQQTQQEICLVERLQAVSLDSNQLLNVSVAFFQIVTLAIQVLIQRNPNVVQRNSGQMCVLQAGLLISSNLFEMSSAVNVVYMYNVDVNTFTCTCRYTQLNVVHKHVT